MGKCGSVAVSSQLSGPTLAGAGQVMWIDCMQYLFSSVDIMPHTLVLTLGCIVLYCVVGSSGLHKKVCGSVRLLIRHFITLIGVRLAEGVLDRRGQESTITTYYSQPAHKVLNLWRRRHQ